MFYLILQCCKASDCCQIKNDCFVFKRPWPWVVGMECAVRVNSLRPGISLHCPVEISYICLLLTLIDLTPCLATSTSTPPDLTLLPQQTDACLCKCGAFRLLFCFWQSRTRPSEPSSKITSAVPFHLLQVGLTYYKVPTFPVRLWAPQRALFYLKEALFWFSLSDFPGHRRRSVSVLSLTEFGELQIMRE